MSKPYELQGIPRMHIHKVREIEEMVWYRENSIRFMKLSKPKAVIGIITGIVILPYVFQSWLIWNNVCSVRKLPLAAAFINILSCYSYQALFVFRILQFSFTGNACQYE
jgi:phosphoglycerol transferase MdoB-like AlkP superfamily enzyme